MSKCRYVVLGKEANQLMWVHKDGQLCFSSRSATVFKYKYQAEKSISVTSERRRSDGMRYLSSENEFSIHRIDQ